MSDDNLVIEVTHASGGSVTMHVSGEIDAATVRQLNVELLRAVRAAGTLELDVAGVGFIDSSGIRCFLQAKLEADRAGCDLQIVGLRPNSQRILHIAGVERFLGCEQHDDAQHDHAASSGPVRASSGTRAIA
jgi:anti-sigma B factor antagonist